MGNIEAKDETGSEQRGETECRRRHPHPSVAMSTVGDVTSCGEGHFLWHLWDMEVSRRGEFHVLSPSFWSSGCRYWMELEEQKDSRLVEATLRRDDGLPLPRIPHRLELRSGEDVVSPCSSYTLTPDGRRSYISCGVDVAGDLWEGSGSFLFPRLSVSLRTEGDRSFDSRGIQTDVPDSSSRDIEEKNFACSAVQTEVPDSSSRDTEDFAKLQTDLEKLVLGEEDSDVTLEVRGEKFPAHKAIIRVRCPVFDAMFRHNMAEKQSGDVTIEDSDPEAFPDFLHYIYTGSSEKVTKGNVSHLFEMSDKYEVLQLKSLCGEFMKSHVSLETFCDFLTVAVKYHERDLIRAATEFFCESGGEILQSIQWQIFIQNNPLVANELLIKAASRWKTA